jgi:hypothetical protein
VIHATVAASTEVICSGEKQTDLRRPATEITENQKRVENRANGRFSQLEDAISMMTKQPKGQRQKTGSGS